MDNAVRDGIEVLIVVAFGGLVWQTIGRVRRGEVGVYRCVACERPTSRAYARCRHCGAVQPEHQRR